MKKLLCCLSVVALMSFSSASFAATPSVKLEKANQCSQVQSLKNIDSLVGSYNHKVKIVFSDIDGTLVTISYVGQKPVVSEKLKKTVKQLKQNNIPIVLVTGRSYSDVKDIAHQLGLDKAYFVVLKGSTIFGPDGNVIYNADINHEDSIKIIKDFYNYPRKNPKTSGVYFFYKDKESGLKDFVLPYRGDNVKVFKGFNELGKDFKASKIDMYNEDIEELLTFEKYIKNKYPNYSVDRSAPRYCDLTSSLAGKGNAVEKLSAILGIPLENAVVFGDAENDLSMFKTVRKAGGLTVAVGNALPVLKQNADFQTLTVEDNGVSYAINKILANNKILDNSNKCQSCKK